MYVVAGVLGAGVLLFFSLTRTEVGRDALRHQIERQFAQTFEGRLEIGALKGNLVQQLFADEVRLYDPDDRLVWENEGTVRSFDIRKSLFDIRPSKGPIIQSSHR